MRTICHHLQSILNHSNERLNEKTSDRPEANMHVRHRSNAHCCCCGLHHWCSCSFCAPALLSIDHLTWPSEAVCFAWRSNICHPHQSNHLNLPKRFFVCHLGNKCGTFSSHNIISDVWLHLLNLLIMHCFFVFEQLADGIAAPKLGTFILTKLEAIFHELWWNTLLNDVIWN